MPGLVATVQHKGQQGTCVYGDVLCGFSLLPNFSVTCSPPAFVSENVLLITTKDMGYLVKKGTDDAILGRHYIPSSGGSECHLIEDFLFSGFCSEGFEENDTLEDNLPLFMFMDSIFF